MPEQATTFERDSTAAARRPLQWLRSALGPALNLKELNLICWGLYIAFLVLPVCVVMYVKVRAGEFTRPPEVDFVYFYSMGRIFNEHPPAEAYDYTLQKKICNEVHLLTSGTYGPIPYPPFVGTLFRPFARLPFNVAFVLWALFSFGLYLAGLRILARQFFPDDPLRRSLIFCLALVFYPLNWTMMTGHLSTIGFFAMALALREEDRGHPIRSGLALSICLYKPTLIVLVLPMLIVTRRFKTIAGFGAGALTLAFAATAIEGIRIWSGYLNMLFNYGRVSVGVASHTFKQGWKYIDFSSFASLMQSRMPGVRIILFGFAFCVGLALLRIWWKSPGSGRIFNILMWAATLTWTLLINIYVPIYDSILVVPSVIATAGVMKVYRGTPLYGSFSVAWLLILAFSWFTVDLAETSGFQAMTLFVVALGLVQFVALRKAGVQDNPRRA